MNQISNQSSAFFKDTLAQLTAPPSGGKKIDARCPLPSWTDTAMMLEDLRALLLMTLDADDAQLRLNRVLNTLDAQLNICTPTDNNSGCEPATSDNFLALLPKIKYALQEDTETALRSDPAVTSRIEVTLCYPGLRALAYHRIARALLSLDVPLLPRLVTEIGHSVTGIDIHPGAKIGKRFFIDHGTGVVIGATCVIGDDVKIYQGVTLGARSFPRCEKGHIIKGIERHPIIGDRVTIYSGATILGRVRIGADSVIGGNVWVTRDVPANSHVVQRRPRQDNFIHGDGI